MADYGLTLPENDLTPAEFKDLARRLGRAAFVPLFLKFYERIVTGEATIEEQRKALADISRWTGVEEDRKVDPNANLPVFNIIFGAPTAKGGGTLEVVEIPQESAPQEVPSIGAEELDMFGTLATNAAFREMAHRVMSPPPESHESPASSRVTRPQEVSHAELQASPPADGPQPDAAPVVETQRPADSPDQSAGSGAPDSGHVPHVRERSVRTRGARAAGAETVQPAVPAPAAAHSEVVQEAPEVLARSHDTLDDALRTLDAALDGF